MVERLTREYLEELRTNALEDHDFAESAYQDGSGDCDELAMMLAREASSVLDLLAHTETLEQELRTEIKASEAICPMVALVYDHITNGQISKPTTLASVVIAVADDVTRQDVDGELAESRAREDALEKLLEEAREALVSASVQPWPKIVRDILQAIRKHREEE